MNWLLIWIIIYLILIVVLSLRHIRSTDMEQYMVNNRSTHTFPLVATTLATFVGGGTSIGLMALGYESGFAAVGIGIAYVIGFFIMSRYAGKIRNFGAEHRIYSFPHYLNFIYNKRESVNHSRAFTITVSGVNIFIFFFMLAAQFVAMASLLRFSFTIDYNLATIVSAIIVIVYTAIAGLSGVIITDIIQFSAIVLMIVFIFIPGVWIDTDHFTRLDELPPDFLTGTHYGYTFLIGLFVFLSWSVLVRMDIWQRILAAKDAKTAKKASIISGIGMLPFYIIFPLVGMTIRLTNSDVESPKDVAYIFINSHSQGFLLAFAVVGMLSALMSSGDSFLNIISISAVKDFWNDDRDVSNQGFLIRIVTLVFGLTAMLIALTFPHIVDLMVLGLSTISIFVPITLLALIDDKAGKYSKIALISILAGFTVNVVFFVFGLMYPEKFQAKSSFVPGFITAALVVITGIYLKKKTNFNSRPSL